MEIVIIQTFTVRTVNSLWHTDATSTLRELLTFVNEVHRKMASGLFESLDSAYLVS